MQITHLLITKRLAGSQPCGICMLMRKDREFSNTRDNTQKISSNDYYAHHIAQKLFYEVENIFCF